MKTPEVYVTTFSISCQYKNVRSEVGYKAYEDNVDRPVRIRSKSPTLELFLEPGQPSRHGLFDGKSA